jgi:23S rRNA pseudouridine1911/1915/1917 synthase
VDPDRIADQLLRVIDETAELLVVDKPAGLVCHPTKAGPMSSLIGRIRLYLGHDEGRLVHRLDRETSGVVVIAKSQAAAASLGRVLAADGVRKNYLALVYGHVATETIRIEAPLGKDERSAVAIKDAVRADGASAVTRVAVKRRLTSVVGPCTLIDVWPETGRKHQIRIHLAHAGFPIVGDKIYGADETRYLRFVTDALTEADRRALGLEHHALRAARLELVWGGRAWAWDAGESEVEMWLRRVEAVAV